MIIPIKTDIIILGINPPIKWLINCLFLYPIDLYMPKSIFFFSIIDDTSINSIKYTNANVTKIIIMLITLTIDTYIERALFIDPA